MKMGMALGLHLGELLRFDKKGEVQKERNDGAMMVHRQLAQLYSSAAVQGHHFKNAWPRLLRERSN